VWGTRRVSGLCWLFVEGPSQPLCPLLLPQAPLLPGTWGLWPLPTDAASVPCTPLAASKCGGCWVSSQSSCGRWRGGHRGVPLPGSGLSIVLPPWLSCHPEPGPGPHSCGDAPGLRAGAGEREGH